MVEVLDHAPLKNVQLTALVAVAERVNDHTRTGYAAREEVARRIRRSVRTASTVLGQLVDAGLLEVVTPGGGRGRATVFRVPPMPGAPATGNREVQASRKESVAEPGNRETQTSRNPPVDNSGNRETQASPFTEQKPGSMSFRETGQETGKSEPLNREVLSLNREAQTSPQPSYNPRTNPRPRARARETAPSPLTVDDDPQTDPLTDADPLTRAAHTALTETSPRPVTLEHATAVAHQILDGRDVRDPAAYIRRAIHDDPDRFAPPAAAPSDRTLAEALGHARAPDRTFDPDRAGRGAGLARALLKGGEPDA